ncbi:hypothetical protein JTB14_006454 [Gonioctena quinquepunctata]|nr:hypothetical protein JTB14_006454 [Gonioctena quinquepunctata]
MLKLSKKTVPRSKKRLEMLMKWKEDKAKRKQEENKETKGKSVDPEEKTFVKKFAPLDHTFHASQNIKPIHFVKSAKTREVMSRNVTSQPQQQRGQPKRTGETKLKDQKPKSTTDVPQKDPMGTKSRRILSSKEQKRIKVWKPPLNVLSLRRHQRTQL